ncbi:MAG: hypothetical protein ABJO09_11630 [Hyphomicrobiales bacterium]
MRLTSIATLVLATFAASPTVAQTFATAGETIGCISSLGPDTYYEFLSAASDDHAKFQRMQDRGDCIGVPPGYTFEIIELQLLGPDLFRVHLVDGDHLDLWGDTSNWRD